MTLLGKISFSTVHTRWQTKHFTPLVIVVLLVGLLLRLVLPFRGFNYDIESWKIAADIMAHGGNVYAETGRYNYGPIWFHILHLLDAIPGTGFGQFFAFRYKVAAFLTCVDVAIFMILLRRFNVLVAALFFLSPISIIITGLHSQMDNLAVLFGLIGILFLEKDKRADVFFIFGLLFLALSLSTKHLLFFLPIWLAIKEERWSRKLLIIGIPYAVFIGLFAPYWELGQTGIINNVFLYRSFNNAPFWTVFAPAIFLTVLPPVILFFSALFVLGLVWRKKPLLETYFLYLISVVVFSSAIANQYLAIPTAAIATQWNWAYALFTAFSTVYLAVDWAGLSIGMVQKALHWQGQNGYYPAITLLFIGLMVQVLPLERRCLISAKIGQGWAWFWQELRAQFKAPW